LHAPQGVDVDEDVSTQALLSQEEVYDVTTTLSPLQEVVESGGVQPPQL